MIFDSVRISIAGLSIIMQPLFLSTMKFLLRNRRSLVESCRVAGADQGVQGLSADAA